jgi:acetyl-CoA acyltransferase
VNDVYVIDGGRTVFGKAGGKLAGVRPDDLAAAVLSGLVARNPALDPEVIDDVQWGATNQAGDDSRNVARIAAVLAGLPLTVPGSTVNRLCGSGLEAISSASRAIRSGEIDVCLAGGSESMSRAPFVLPRAETAYQRQQPVWDSRLGWRSVNPRWREQYGARALGECAELIAERFGISRERQDSYAAQSHRRAAEAWERGDFNDEILPLDPALVVDAPATDESVRPDSTPEGLAKLRPVFQRDGTVTAGNSSPMNDGAAGVLLASGEAVERMGLTPLARIAGSHAVGVHPDGLDGPVPATRMLLKRLGWSIDSLDLVELSEAFASQAVACVDELKLDAEKVNRAGGAIAIGHPLAASGARLVATLVHQLKRTGGRRGVATLCIGVGQGQSLAVEVA